MDEISMDGLKRQINFYHCLLSLTLLDENNVYVNQMFNSENVFTDNLKKMAFNLSDDIEHETAIEDAKHKGTCTITLFLFCTYCFNKSLSINDSTKKHQKIGLLFNPCRAFVTPSFQTDTAYLTSTSYLQTF